MECINRQSNEESSSSSNSILDSFAASYGAMMTVMEFLDDF